MKPHLFMLNKFLLFIIVMTYVSCNTYKIHLEEKMFSIDEEKYNAFNFFAFGKNMDFIQYYKNDSIAYKIKGNVSKTDDYTYLTENETVESTLVDSSLNIIELTYEQKEKIEQQISHDTIKFSKDFNKLNYNGVLYNKK